MGRSRNNQATFNSVLEVTTGAFAITGNKIEAEILIINNGSKALTIAGKNITNINYITIPDLQLLNVGDNPFTSFNPSKPLPNGLKRLGCSYCSSLSAFNPSISLPKTLTILDLIINNFNLTSYTNMEPWATLQETFTDTCSIYLWDNSNSVSGTNLETILLTKNTTITA